MYSSQVLTQYNSIINALINTKHSRMAIVGIFSEMINQPLHCEMIFTLTTIDHSSYLMVETSPLIIACEVVYTDNHALTILAT